MAIPKSGIIIRRQSILGMEGMFVKMWDPPTESPPTPDVLAPTNPVPEVMAMFGYQDRPSTPHTVQRDLLHGPDLPAWDGKLIKFFLFRDKDNPATGGGNFPGATIRVPRGVIFHGDTLGHGPPPHTIHWHGIEPTPINDGVGHCSMEVGNYTYQFQPNFIGFYFCHCHRNTVQHFEFGLYQALLIDPPDAYWATLVDPTIPVGFGRDRKRRIAANLTGTPLVALQDNFNPLDAPDPWATGSPPDKWTDDPRLQFATDPHAMTVPFDVEALWVVDDRDSRWSDEAPGARATYPKHHYIPGVDDNFRGNAGGGTVDSDKFFAFNDFNADYWYVTGVPVTPLDGVKRVGPDNIGAIPPALTIPPALISGVSGVQVSIEAEVGQTILVRMLDAAYDCTETTFPVPVTVIAWDGRALGVPPYGFNHAYTVPAGQHIHQSVARRFDALIKSDVPINDFATVEFVDNEGQVGSSDANAVRVICVARIPINIGYSISGAVRDNTTSIDGVALEHVPMTLSGTSLAGNPMNKTTITDHLGNYRFSGLPEGNYTITPTLDGYLFTPGSIDVTLNANTLGQDFTALQVEGIFVLSGTVVNSRGAAVGVPQIVVILGGDTDQVVMTDDEGHFHFYGLENGDYTVTPGSIHTGNAGLVDESPGQPANAGCAYAPPYAEVRIKDANQNIGFFRARRLTNMGVE